MQRSGAATRRFYAAFYHWTLRSANPTSQRCAGTTATLVPRRKQSTVHGARGKSHSSARGQRHKESIGTTEQLRREPIQSTADRPTDSLGLWDHAVREKSEKSVKVELSVPTRVLRVTDVAKRAQIHEVKLSTPFLRDNTGDDEPCAIVLEGDYIDVKAVWKNIYYHGAGQSLNKSSVAKETTHNDIEPIAHRLRQDFARGNQPNLVEKECSLPESFWQPIGREGTVEYLQTQFGLRVEILEDEGGPLQYARLKGSERQVREVDRFLEEIRSRELERIHRKNTVNAAGKQAENQVKIIRRTDLPSENLDVWQSVTRKQLEGQTEIDFCLPERVWQELVRNGGAETLHARFAMEFEPLEISRSGKTRCITLRGDVVHADRAKSYLEGFQVNLPKLQDDQEYLRIHSAATGLHTIDHGGRQQSAPRVGEKRDTNKHIAQAASTRLKKELANPLPAAQSTHDERIPDALHHANSALSEEIDEAASWNSYKRLAITSPEEQPTHDNVMGSLHNKGRFDVPEHIRQELEASNKSTIEQIRHESGLEAILCLRTGNSREYLKVIGSKDAAHNARVLLQKSIDNDNERTGRNSPGIDELALSIDAVFTLPEATHVAWIQMPLGTNFGKPRRLALQRKTETRIRAPDNVDGRQVLRVVGPTAAVKFAVAEIQRFVQEERKATDKSPGECEILKMGLIAIVGEDSPLESSAKATLSDEQTSVPIVDKLYAPEAKPHQTHFAFLSLVDTIAQIDNGNKRKAIAEKHDCFIGKYARVDKAEGMMRIFGTKDAISNAISDLQEVIDDTRKVQGELPAKIEVVGIGLCGDMPDPRTVKKTLSNAAAAKRREQALEGIERTAAARSPAPQVQPTHFAWIKIKLLLTESPFGRLRPMLVKAVQKTGCKISDLIPADTAAGKVEVVARLLGPEDALKSAIEAMEQLMATEMQKTSGASVGKIEMVQMGFKKDMGDFTASKLSIQAGGSAISTEQRAPMPQQAPIENGAAEQAKRVASTLSNSKKSEGPIVDVANKSNAKEAEGQPTQQSNQKLSDDMRSALRHITQPVALVTSFEAKHHLARGEEKHTLARGVTVSSFCTVTLHPIPVVSFNLRVPSRSWDAISGSGYLRVHLLKATPEGATVAHAFTLPYEQPDEPFKQLSQLRSVHVQFNSKTRNPAKVARIVGRDAIHADFVAKVMPEKCIEVGDHMIIVAEVTEMSTYEDADATDAGALAYGMKGYRQLGGEMKPMELNLAEPTPSNAKSTKEAENVVNVPDEAAKHAERGSVVEQTKSSEEAPSESVGNDLNMVAEPTEQESAFGHLRSDEKAPDNVATNSEVDLYELLAASDENEDFEATPVPAPKNIEDLGPSSPMLDEESLRQVLEENEAAYSSQGLPSQTAADNPMLAEALKAVSGAYHGASEPAVSSQPETTSQTQVPSFSHSADLDPSPQLESETQAQSLVDPPADFTVSSQPESTSQTEVPPVEKPAGGAERKDRQTSVLSTSRHPWGMNDTMTQQIRKLSIYRTSHSYRHYSSSSSSSPNPQPPILKKILKTTVADYLCQIPTHKKRYTNLIKLQRSVESFEHQLQHPDASMTEQEAAELSDKAAIARRKVSRELALRNAQDLRAMLDKGRVQASAVQWLESNLEHGQVVLLDEAKVLRRELEGGKLRVEEFEKAKAELTRDYEAIDAQLMRLRDFADEDDVEDMHDEDGFEEGSGFVEEEERTRGQ
jgi:flavin reductase (DIM6/NTAB) family NADH-FMN oxidoreductase RutF